MLVSSKLSRLGALHNFNIYICSSNPECLHAHCRSFEVETSRGKLLLLHRMSSDLVVCACLPSSNANQLILRFYRSHLSWWQCHCVIWIHAGSLLHLQARFISPTNRGRPTDIWLAHVSNVNEMYTECGMMGEDPIKRPWPFHVAGPLLLSCCRSLTCWNFLHHVLFYPSLCGESSQQGGPFG
jgi:hypothetical protein